MKAIPTEIPDVIILEPQVFYDARGFFMETYHTRELAELGITAQFVQDNHSRSQSGTLRGLHYQIRHAQGKLVRVVSGEIFDVAVDLRRNSPTFGQWTGAILSADNKRQLWVPPGFAHGIYALSETIDLLYKCTDYYAPEWERTLLWNDPQIAVAWPLVDGQPPVLSAKDAQGRPFSQAEVFED
ncbi:MAG TPA: dTDP-4-dehydrorhamnose 3,5-epimerase [Anaerolineae bacterium]|nr:dTDP-4-dehydrorhamnose 3,5-epimerase [Anaerolineae bacterium]